MPIKPIASIIVRTRNRPKYLRECLHSLAIQSTAVSKETGFREQKTSALLEVIIVNDGGDKIDLSFSPFPDYVSLNIVDLIYPKGRSKCANIGLEIAKGEFIGFLDDDDILYPNHLSTLIPYLKNNETELVYSDGLLATQVPYPSAISGYATVNLELVYSKDFSYHKLKEGNFIPIHTALFKRKVVKEWGICFDEKLEVVEDWDFWLQIAKRTSFKHIKEITCEYRIRNDGTNTIGQFDHLWRWSENYVREKHQARWDQLRQVSNEQSHKNNQQGAANG